MAASADRFARGIVVVSRQRSTTRDHLSSAVRSDRSLPGGVLSGCDFNGHLAVTKAAAHSLLLEQPANSRQVAQFRVKIFVRWRAGRPSQQRVLARSAEILFSNHRALQ